MSCHMFVEIKEDNCTTTTNPTIYDLGNIGPGGIYYLLQNIEALQGGSKRQCKQE